MSGSSQLDRMPAMSATPTQSTSPRRERKWLPVLVIAVAALTLVVASYAFSQWQHSRPATPARDLQIAVESAGQSHQIPPYTVCELDEECAGGQPPAVALDDNPVTFTVPSEIAALSWRLLVVYDDPAANNEVVFTSGEAEQHTVDAVTDSGAKLVVGEVSALGIDYNEQGEEVPVLATWSVGFEGAE